MITFITGFNLKRLPPTQIVHWHPQCEEHPSIQSAWARNIMTQAGDEDMVIVSNSDHIFNGIRVAVRIDLAPVPKIEYHNREGKVFEITMLANGRCSFWPEGFFDQIEEDLSLLM